jgi:RHS repeat-associated protein
MFFAAGQLIATYENDGQGIHFHLSDWLGTRHVTTDDAGNPQSSYQNLPFGELVTPGQSLGVTEHFFTGKERDTESGLDYFGARYYASSMGRFSSPDPMGQFLH